ncbi:hypothetical protein FZC76_21610 [Sutcliffiella horikoshii]|uniref:Uncharacterized protein n=1 Tax=Sutcliffiella horikoshii TaxID=79883 RepID=A0A5D4SES8_9BACI|nr:hypothetical protein [Sutcliffiella horikoshii]TYS60472.1 hypothetical protein FZC76_21610 [Sutcliffiella horikoshii]
MMESIKDYFNTPDSVLLGSKRAKVKKVTPEVFLELMKTIETLPGLILRVAVTPKEHMMETAIIAGEIAMDDLLAITSVLSGIDQDYLRKEAGLSELVDYLTKTYKKNDFFTMIKNVKSLLPKQQ